MNTPRWLVALFALIVGFVVAWLILRPRAGGPDFTSCPVMGSITVVVGPGASVVKPPCVEIDQYGKDTLSWLAREKGKNIRIEFTEQPFLGMQPSGTRYVVNCPGTDECTSGTIDPNIPSGAQPLPNDSKHKYKAYKYWQILHDTATNKDDIQDGKIIIRW
jgi:hypothetical protein